MIRIGLTGSIGMGKSAVSAMFRQMGVPVFDADAEVHKLQGPGGALVARIEARFPGTTGAQGVDRQKLGAAVLGKPEELRALEHADFVRILSETRANLPTQYKALLATEEVTFEFTDDAIDAIARIAFDVNSTVENIGARRLQTVMEKLLEDISFDAEDRKGETLKIDAAYVSKQLSGIAKDTDLSKYVL
mgnify:CR=1 FL=1